MSIFGGGGGDDSGVDQEIALEQEEYNDEVYQTDTQKADLDNELLTQQHAESGPLFTDVSSAATLNPEKS